MCLYIHTHIHNAKACFNKISVCLLNDCHAPLSILWCNYENNKIVKKLSIICLS